MKTFLRERTGLLCTRRQLPTELPSVNSFSLSSRELYKGKVFSGLQSENFESLTGMDSRSRENISDNSPQISNRAPLPVVFSCHQTQNLRKRQHSLLYVFTSFEKVSCGQETSFELCQPCAMRKRTAPCRGVQDFIHNWEPLASKANVVLLVGAGVNWSVHSQCGFGWKRLNM